MNARQHGPREELFDAADLIGCETYIALRDRINERCMSARAHCEQLWESFYRFADPHFVSNFRLQFHQRWFEMYLTVALERAGYAIESADRGPDICVAIGGQRVWIEATCALAGASDNPDAVPPKLFDQIQGEPINQTTLRILNSLDVKQRKFVEYRAQGLVDERDIALIAINIFELPGGFENVSVAFERALFGFAGTELAIDWKSGQEVLSRRKHQTEIQRSKSGAPVDVMPFAGGKLPHIAGALASGMNVLNRDWPPARLGASLIAYPNMGAVSTFAPDLIELGVAMLPERDAGGAWCFRELDHERSRS